MPIRFSPNGTTHGSYGHARTLPIAALGGNRIGMTQTFILRGVDALNMTCGVRNKPQHSAAVGVALGFLRHPNGHVVLPSSRTMKDNFHGNLPEL